MQIMSQHLKHVHIDYIKTSYLKGLMLVMCYPVGSIYMFMNSTEPAQLFGGNWERIIRQFLYCTPDESGEEGE